MEKTAKEFSDNLKKADAENLKLRILKAAEKIIKKVGLNKERLKEVEVDISDFLK